MKRKTVLLLLCVTVTISLVGCQGKHATEKPERKTKVKVEQAVPSDMEPSEEKDVEETNQTEQEQKQEASEAEKKEEKNSVQKEEKQEKQTVTSEKQQTISGQGQTKKQPSQLTTPTSTTSTTETPKVDEPAPVPDVPKATASDNVAIANKVIEYINSYRSSSATKLPGLTKYAEYRSRQLISNFAHDTFDERAAATALQYGTYIDPPLYGMTGEPYYAAGAREAIAKGGYVGTIDEIAQRLAILVKNSAGHWAYVGSSEYPYIAVGVTYESGMWYCDIAMARENTDIIQ